KVFSHNVNTPEKVVLFLENFFSFSWILIPAFAFYFFALQTKKDYLIKNKLLLISIIIFSTFFYLNIWLGNVFENFELKNYGWFRKWKNNILVYLFYIYLISLISLGLFFLIKYYFELKNKLQKRILKVFVLASIGIFILVLSLEFLELLFMHYNLGKSFLEDIPNLYAIIFVIAFFYLISKYKFFKIAPVYAAEKIISSMNESLIITDNELDIVFVNENAKKIFMDNSEQLINKSCAILFNNKVHFNKLLKDLIKNEYVKNFETEFKTMENKIIPVLISASLIKEINEMIGVVFVVSDITEYKKAQLILKESYEKLLELDTLKTNFLSMVSHELRTPLTTILGFLSLILGGATGKVPEYMKEYLEIMKTNSERLLSLINDLLDISKLEAGIFTISKVQTDIINIIKEAIKNLKPIYSKRNITISFDTTINSLKINIDPTRILQVINNLVNNAIKFSKDNSKIVILLYKKCKKDINVPKNFNYDLLKSENYIIIKIIDEGRGIEPKYMDKIFDKFFQAEDINTRKAQGAGLGLYIAKEIVTMHDGFIWAESEGKDRGSTFTLLLPLD
ncbi:MAG: ATP-binding protein, partial [Candidatus Goldbacteria bacterium]|nr:ATP-binding protein [Candidatus Goldiibacteriota bacterium]